MLNIVKSEHIRAGVSPALFIIKQLYTLTMLKCKVVIGLILLCFTAVPCFADYRFAVIGDTRDGSADGINNKVMQAILDNIKIEGVKFIIVTGDMITGSTRSNIHGNRLNKWKAIIERYDIPYYISAGNHEIESEDSEDILRSVFNMPENGPAGCKELVYSFDYQNSHFIAVDTNLYNNFHNVGGEQLKWLEQDLENNKKNIIFVFGHEPAYPVSGHIGSSLDRYAAERDRLWGIFKEYKVDIYFCGHEHLYNRSIHDVVYQIITGGGGARLDNSEEKLSYYHFILVDVKDEGAIEITVKDIEGTVRDNFNLNIEGL